MSYVETRLESEQQQMLLQTNVPTGHNDLPFGVPRATIELVVCHVSVDTSNHDTSNNDHKCCLRTLLLFSLVASAQVLPATPQTKPPFLAS